MSAYYGDNFDDVNSIKVLNHALDLGCNFWDTADVYGNGANEELLAKVLNTRRKEVFLCTKFAVKVSPTGERKICGKPEFVLEACDASLKRLGTDYIDLYYQHRVDPETPIEETIGAMKQLVEAGKVKYIGLSECSAETLRRAHKVHPITAVQMEFSPWSLDIESNGILEACKELDVAVICYSPLGRGFLTGEIKSPEDFAPTDFRRMVPRFQGENFKKNYELVTAFEELAKNKGVATSQFVLAWVLARCPNFIPIPGTTKIHRLEENLHGAQVQLTPEDLESVEKILATIPVAGTRYNATLLSSVNK
ncbi:hypothetical protein SAMD00019534_008820 [Acytostelium subglobosum LB1]|uniref:hypothetical protein n=1 Tax=Acytostelium subglobosum LB1 TaxID=1410327 RepID=UPI000644E183|nr:hypothetical protein SAMD00019534_008820 [Acytostelium subglobosum LB1]GAM17707.1 hypothetical protein SAMD00019534_008820 [Acytostelium subglobosum LB1]|eukprot:XP_012758303.1 hypothetical protein SAMD00019534_008820 [Acytostelium subglobosum LB1]